MDQNFAHIFTLLQTIWIYCFRETDASGRQFYSGPECCLKFILYNALYVMTLHIYTLQTVYQPVHMQQLH